MAINTADLVAYWKFSDLTDSVGSNDFTNNGATYGASSGIITGGYSYITNDYMSIGTGISDFYFSGGDDVSMSIWMKVNSSLTTRAEFININGSASNTNKLWLCRIDATTGYLRTQIEGNNGTHIVFTGSVDYRDDDWHHFVFINDATNSRYKIYVDGSEVTSAESDVGTGAVIDSTSYIQLGRNRSAANYYLNGVLDEFGFWNGHALTSAEVTELYNSGSGLQYPFSGGSGWTGTINGVTDPAKVNGIAVANISKINGQ